MELNLVRGTAGADLFQVYWDPGHDAYCLVTGGEMKLKNSGMEILLSITEDENAATDAVDRIATCVVTVGEDFEYSKEIGPRDVERHDLMQKAGQHVLHLGHHITDLETCCRTCEARLLELDCVISGNETKIGQLSRELHEERLERMRLEPDFKRTQTIKGSLWLLSRHFRNLTRKLLSRPPR